MYSIIANRTLHDLREVSVGNRQSSKATHLSSLKVVMAGSKDCESNSMPITRLSSVKCYNVPQTKPTFVDVLKFRNDVQTDVRKLILEHL